MELFGPGTLIWFRVLFLKRIFFKTNIASVSLLYLFQKKNNDIIMNQIVDDS